MSVQTFHHWSKTSPVNSNYCRLETTVDNVESSVIACSSLGLSHPGNGVHYRVYCGYCSGGNFTFPDDFAEYYSSVPVGEMKSLLTVSQSANVAVGDIPKGAYVAGKLEIVIGTASVSKLFIASYQIPTWWLNVRMTAFTITISEEWKDPDGTYNAGLIWGYIYDALAGSWNNWPSSFTVSYETTSELCRVRRGSTTLSLQGFPGDPSKSELRIKTGAGVSSFYLVSASESPVRIKTPAGIKGIYSEEE